MFKFLNTDSSLIGDTKDTEFIHLLRLKWDELHDRIDVFRYKIEFKEKLLDSTYLLQLNPNRSTKRRTPENIGSICQPFDESKFNFSKVSPREIMFHIVEDKDESNKHTLLVNISPISRYHSLLCPSLSKFLPQVATMESIKLALNIMFISRNRDLRIGFNSLCALASVNHLHYHLFLEPHDLPVESVECKHIIGPLYIFKNYPIPAFCLQCDENSIETVSKAVDQLLKFFLKKSIAHNILLTRGKSVEMDNSKETVRVVIWPRKSSSGVKQLTDFNIAVCELSGWFPVFNLNCFENIKRVDLENEMQKWKVENFDEVYEEVKNICFEQ